MPNPSRRLAIVHPHTGEVFRLSDNVLLVDLADVEFDFLDGVDMPKVHELGFRLDDSNMARLFFGDEV